MAKIWLIGYRCSGKTSVGRLLARALQWPLVDTDRLVEELAGATIAELVAREGWEGFRERERMVLEELLARPGEAVVACGGGVVHHAREMEAAAARDLVVWLQVSPEAACSRMEGDAATSTQRPSLTGCADRLAEAREMIARREPLYRRFASLVLDSDRLSPRQMAEEIMRYMKGVKQKEAVS